MATLKQIQDFRASVANTANRLANTTFQPVAVEANLPVNTSSTESSVLLNIFEQFTAAQDSSFAAVETSIEGVQNNIGTIESDIEDLQDSVQTLNTTKAPLDSPTLTGTPTTPTAANNTNTQQIASCSFVINQIAATTPGAANVAQYAQNTYIDNDYYMRKLSVGTTAFGANGEIRATNDITAFYASDIKYKTNIAQIENATEKVIAIGGKTFEWTDEYIKSRGGEDGYFVNKKDFGVIAQDVLKNFPMAAHQRPDGSWAVDYPKLCALAFAAIAELKQEIDELKRK